MAPNHKFSLIDLDLKENRQFIVMHMFYFDFFFIQRRTSSWVNLTYEEKYTYYYSHKSITLLHLFTNNERLKKWHLSWGRKLWYLLAEFKFGTYSRWVSLGNLSGQNVHIFINYKCAEGWKWRRKGNCMADRMQKCLYFCL